MPIHNDATGNRVGAKSYDHKFDINGIDPRGRPQRRPKFKTNLRDSQAKHRGRQHADLDELVDLDTNKQFPKSPYDIWGPTVIALLKEWIIVKEKDFLFPQFH